MKDYTDPLPTMKASCWTLIPGNPKQPVLNGSWAPDNMMRHTLQNRESFGCIRKTLRFFFLENPGSPQNQSSSIHITLFFVGVSTSDFILLGALGLHFIENSGQSKMAMILDHMFLYILERKLPQGCKNCIKSSTTKQI